MAYRAEIEIGVTGVRQLEQARSAINLTARAVDSLNDAVSGGGGLVQSIQNYANNLNRAAISLRNVGAGTEAEAKAVREYVQALGEANQARARQNFLIAQQLANQRRVRPDDAGFGQQTPALPPGTVQSAQIKQTWSQFFRDAADVAADLQQATAARRINIQNSWRTFFEDAADTAVQLKQSSAAQRINIQNSWKTFFADAADLATDLKTNSAAQRINIQNSWNIFFQDAADLAADLTAQIRSFEAAQSSAARARLLEESRRREGGPVSPPGGGGGGGGGGGDDGDGPRRPSSLANVALGAGFPLLFGGGAGSVIGGALGGLVPGPEGFAAQIALSALGQQLDIFATNLNGLADSLGNPTAALQAFETAGIKVNDVVKVQVENLVKQGEAYKAQQLIFEELTKALGPDAVQQLNAYDKELANLEQKYRELSNSILKELLPALTGLLNYVSAFIELAEKASKTDLFKEAMKFLERSSPIVAGGKFVFDKLSSKGKEVAKGASSTRDLDAETKAEMAEIRRKEMLERIKELQKEELSIIKAKAMSEQGLVDATARRMDMQSSIASAASAAFLQVNDLEMQRAKNAGDTEKQYRLQLQRAQLIYKQTVLQVQQEQRKAELAVLSSQLRLKELEAEVARKAAKGEALAEDYAAIELQKQAVQLAYEGVNAAKLIAEYNLMSANALRQMTVEQAAFNRTQAAGSSGGVGGAGGGVGAGGVNIVSSGTMSYGAQGSITTLANDLAQAGVTGTFTVEQATGIAEAMYNERVAQYQAATKGTQDYSAYPSESQLQSKGFAQGGFVTRPTNALIGEGGESEYVIPSSKMSTAMQRYSAGVRGEAVTAGAVTAGSTSTANYSSQQNAYYGGGGGISVNISTGPVVRMNNRDYVTMTDMQRGMAAAANAGQANMMRQLGRSYAARRSMGL